MSIIPNANNPFLEESPLTAGLPESAAALMMSSSGSEFEWQETADAHVLKADVPGLKKEEMKIEIDDGMVLQVSGERTVETAKDDGDGSHRVERSSCSCSFKKCFTLPPNAKFDLIKASYENGLLTITIPKKNEAIAIENSY